MAGLSITVLCLDFVPGLVAPFTFSTSPNIASPQYSPALPPVPLSRLKAVLDHDMAAQQDAGTGHLALGREGGSCDWCRSERSSASIYLRNRSGRLSV